MKRNSCVLSLLYLVGLLMFGGCGRLGEGASLSGKICITFSEGSELLTKSFLNIPDTNYFHLKVSSPSGECVYDGAYGDCPEVLEVMPGSYVVTVMSEDFSKPAFDTPVFGDEQCVVVQSGGCVSVHLTCTQINSGVRLEMSDDFRNSYSDAVLFLKSSSGKLMYSFAEKRTAYFLPGTLSVMMSRGAQDQILLVKELQANEMLSVKILTPVGSQETGCGLKISVDTARVWKSEECQIGTHVSGGQVDEALTISEARNAVGQDDVWVSGYIVGGDLTSSAASFKAPFKSMTNILLGPRSAVSDKASCISVQLPDNEVRDALNLVEHPDNIGRRVCLKGDIVASYFGICGMKNTVEYVLY